MIAGDHDQRLAWMLIVKVQGFLNSFVKGQGVFNGGPGVIGMAGPVNLATFHHHEETTRIIKKLNTLFCKLGKRYVVLGPVDFVIKCLPSGQGMIIGDNLIAGLRIKVQKFVFIGNNPVVVVTQRIKDIAKGPLNLLKASSAEIVKAAGSEIVADLVIHVAAGLMGVKNSRGCVINGYAGDNTHLHSLFLGCFSKGFVGSYSIRVHGNDTNIGLHTAGHSGSRGSRTGNESIIGIGGAHPVNRQSAHGQFF